MLRAAIAFAVGAAGIGVVAWWLSVGTPAPAVREATAVTARPARMAVAPPDPHRETARRALAGLDRVRGRLRETVKAMRAEVAAGRAAAGPELERVEARLAELDAQAARIGKIAREGAGP